jgi:hypothetical protein
MSYTDDRVFLIDCMVKDGYTQNSARKWLNAFVDRANRRALEDSDHSAYRELADEVEKLIHSESDPDRWDGDDSELYILTVFLEWLPDLIRHKDAENVRAQARTYGDGKTGMIAIALNGTAEDIDPFRQEDTPNGPVWVRKSDDREVPWNVVNTEGDHE